MQNNKSKGSAFERDIAKKLNKWMFGNEIILKRESSSGATKDILSGDIVPVGQLPDSWNKKWPFHIETKKGYPSEIPTPFKYEELHNWIKKAYQESLIHEQLIILLIVQFTGRETIFFTNYDLSHVLNYIISFNINVESNLYQEYKCYKFKELLKLDFYNSNIF